MSNDLIRLSEFVPEHARYHGLDTPTAAYDLAELIDALTQRHLGTTGKGIPQHVCWVGGIATSRQSNKRCKPDYKNLLDYFESWSNSSANISRDFLDCYSEAERDYVRIPAASVYFSRKSLKEWIQTANLAHPEFLEINHTAASKAMNEEEEAFKGKELVSIQGLTRGLIEIITAVDSAHRGLLDKEHATAILKAASQLRESDKTSKWHAALIDLAELAKADDFRSNRKTLLKYIGSI
ncbi:hypothetical protein VXJ36_22960 [Pseudomonas nitroreducens]|uniref:hypothetical protein n=1 Tax=Pseudomonas nitroreducens TaxID=46680 RepID=UPI002F358E0D